MKKIYLFTDGAARGNPGPAGAGIVLVDEAGEVVFEDHRFLGKATNNQAEYLALKIGLERTLELGHLSIEIRLDSELVVRQVKGEYRVKNQGLKPYFKEVIQLLNRFDSYSVEHVPRERNSEADRLANRAIDEAL